MARRSKREQRAKDAAFADLEAGVIDEDRYAREVTLIQAGRSDYLKQGLIARMAKGDMEAIIRVGLIVASLVLVLIIALALLSPNFAGQEDRDDRPAQQQPVGDGDEDEFEEDEDD